LSALTKCSGSDDCGDPELILPPPAPITINVDITYEGDDGDITIPVGFAFFGAYFDVNGSFNVPVEITGPLFEVNGNIEIFPEFKFEITPGNTNGPGEVDDPGLGPGDPDRDGEEPPLGPEPTIIGVFVRSNPTNGDRTTLIPDSPGPDILAPGIATVRFAIRAGSISAWTEDIRVKGVNEFVYCPVPWGAVNVSVRSEVGWSNNFTALRGRPLAAFEP